MARTVTPFLMFEGVAEEAMNLYVSLFRDSEIRHIERYGPGEPGAEGSVKRAVFVLGGQRLMCIDSSEKHDFSFTPSFSIFVDCESKAELDEAYKQLSAGGEVLMPLDDYGFSTEFGWVNDRFGVSWQLNLAPVLLGDGVAPVRRTGRSADRAGTHADHRNPGCNAHYLPGGEIQAGELR